MNPIRKKSVLIANTANNFVSFFNQDRKLSFACISGG